MYSTNLKKIRKELDLSVAKLSEKIDVSPNTISAYERGLRCPSMDFGIQLYYKLNVNLNWFITGEGDMFNKQEVFSDFNQKTEEIVLNVLRKNGLIK